MNDVQVVNHNPFTLKGRFAAKNYVFEPGIPTAIPQAAVEHIFGWNDDDKTGALNRLGLLLPGNGSTYESAMVAYRKVSFHEGRVVFEKGQPKRPQTQDPPSPEGDPQRAPGVPGRQQPGPQPGTQYPGTGPGKDEEDEEEQSATGIGGRPGAVTDPGGKSEAAENPTPSSASDNLDSYLDAIIRGDPPPPRRKPGRPRKAQ